MKVIKDLLEDFLCIIYPKTCCACSTVLKKNEDWICVGCRLELPETDFHIYPRDNELIQRFVGKVELDFAISYLYYRKKGKVQQLLFNLKYHGVEELSELLGRLYVNQLQAEWINSVDIILPVPLHKTRKLNRGYNQVSGFAKVLAEKIGGKYIENVLVRTEHTETQTRKNAVERWENVSGKFKVVSSELIHSKRVLLVDDIVTTGATMEACLQVLLDSGVKSVSIASIAFV